MATLTENLAGQYAAAVHRVLVAEFPRLADRTLELIVLEQVGRNAELPSNSFELVVDNPTVANWRLVPDHAGPDRWRVQLAWWPQKRVSHAIAARERRVNEALRAIPHPYLAAKEA